MNLPLARIVAISLGVVVSLSGLACHESRSESPTSKPSETSPITMDVVDATMTQDAKGERLLTFTLLFSSPEPVEIQPYYPLAYNLRSENGTKHPSLAVGSLGPGRESLEGSVVKLDARAMKVIWTVPAKKLSISDQVYFLEFEMRYSRRSFSRADRDWHRVESNWCTVKVRADLPK